MTSDDIGAEGTLGKASDEVLASIMDDIAIDDAREAGEEEWRLSIEASLDEENEE